MYLGISEFFFLLHFGAFFWTGLCNEVISGCPRQIAGIFRRDYYFHIMFILNPKDFLVLKL